MLRSQPFDTIPIFWVLPLTILLGLGAAELGYRLGGWWQKRSKAERTGSIGAVVGASLALLAFLLAFLIGAAGDRFNSRRLLVVEDANSIGTTELRAQYLPEPYSTDSRALLKQYVDVRVAAVDHSSLVEGITQSEEIQSKLWQMVVDMVKGGQESPPTALYIDALNHMIDVHGERVAAVESRVAPTVLVGVYLIALLGMLLVGLNNRLENTRNWLALIVLVVMFSMVLTLIIDLDRPNEGFLVISQQPMLDLQRQLNK